MFGRELIALVHGTGIYEDELETSDKEQRYAEAQIAFDARWERVPSSAINREIALLESQLSDKEKWKEALRENGRCEWMLRRRVAINSRCREWIEKQLSAAIKVSLEDCRNYFETHQDEFRQPERFSAAHLFLAAPDGTPPELVDVKQRTIQELLSRLDRAEKLGDLVSLFSEDEASKNHAGNLGYFSDWRMPDDFMAAVRQLQVGQTSRVVRTSLGFHIIQLLDARPARPMTFEEAEPEILTRLQNRHRADALAKLVPDSARKAGFAD